MKHNGCHYSDENSWNTYLWNAKFLCFFKKMGRALAHKKLVFCVHGKYLRQFFCSTEKAKWRQIWLQWSVMRKWYSQGSKPCGRVYITVAPFSGIPNVEFMPSAHLSFCQVFKVFPQSIRQMFHYYFIPHIGLFLPYPSHFNFTVILLCYITCTIEKAPLNELRCGFPYKLIIFWREEKERNSNLD